jgi:hypothetical protein
MLYHMIQTSAKEVGLVQGREYSRRQHGRGKRCHYYIPLSPAVRV